MILKKVAFCLCSFAIKDFSAEITKLKKSMKSLPYFFARLTKDCVYQICYYHAFSYLKSRDVQSEVRALRITSLSILHKKKLKTFLTFFTSCNLFSSPSMMLVFGRESFLPSSLLPLTPSCCFCSGQFEGVQTYTNYKSLSLHDDNKKVFFLRKVTALLSINASLPS